MTSISDYYNRLKGVWSFERTIIDHRHNQTLTAQGRASFNQTEKSHTLLYREEGRFNADQEFFRQYTYIFDGDKITILFADGPTSGDVFQTIYPAIDQVTDRHLCGADCYDGNYDFQTENSFTITQHVNGPRKEYRVITLYNKGL